MENTEKRKAENSFTEFPAFFLVRAYSAMTFSAKSVTTKSA